MPPSGHERLDDRIEQWMSQRLGAQNYQGRLKGRVDYRIEGHTLVVTLVNPLLMQWLQARHAPLVQEIASEVIGPNAQVEFQTAAQGTADAPAALQANTAPED